MLLKKAPRLGQLVAELAAAGVAIPNGLGCYGMDDGQINVHTYGVGGIIADLPQAARAVLDAHIPEPEPTRDERIISAADVRKERLAAKKAAILASGLPTATKTAMADLLDGMADIVDGLVEAIQGERP